MQNNHKETQNNNKQMQNYHKEVTEFCFWVYFYLLVIYNTIKPTISSCLLMATSWRYHLFSFSAHVICVNMGLIQKFWQNYTNPPKYWRWMKIGWLGHLGGVMWMLSHAKQPHGVCLETFSNHYLEVNTCYDVMSLSLVSNIKVHTTTLWENGCDLG